MSTKVNDRLVEISVGVIVILVAIIGYLVVDKLETMTLVMIEQNENQKETSREVSKINGFIQTFTSELSTLKENVRVITIKVDGNVEEIYKLKGAK